jgi:rod shape-determining protein MreB
MARLFSPLTKNIGIDLGTCTTQVYVEGRGVVMSEPSVVATDERNNRVVAVGREAESIIAKAPETVKIHRPLQNGVIADYNVTRTMLGYLLSKCVRSVQRMRIMVGIPSAASSVEKRAVLEAVFQAGAKEAFLIETAAAAAIGAGLPVLEPVGNMVIDIGGGTTNIATLSLGGVAVAKSIHLGSLDFDRAIHEYLRNTYNVVTAEHTTEDIKLNVGTAVLPLEDRPCYFTGRGLDDGLQKNLGVMSSEIYRVIGKPILQILDLVKQVLRETPPELAADVMEHGIVLTGGGSLLKGMDVLFSQTLGVPVYVAANAELAVAVGTGRALADREALGAVIEGAQHIYRRRF